ncbi:MAG: hypothetical protein ACE5LH_04680 [Fidelibacterota bacterium]
MIKPEELFSHFEQLAEEMGIVLVEGRGDFRGGYCQVRDEEFIVLNQTKPLESRLRVLAESFGELDIADRYMVPALREFIEKTSGMAGENNHQGGKSFS